MVSQGRGRYSVSVVPASGALSSHNAPLDWRTKPYTVLRPRPVPRPASLVVKKGSKARCLTASVMPLPVSEMAMATKPSSDALGSSRLLRTSAGNAPQGWAAKRSVPPSRMASRALMAMLSNADSNWPGSASTGGQAGATSTSMWMRWSSVRRSMSASE